MLPRRTQPRPRSLGCPLASTENACRRRSPRRYPTLCFSPRDFGGPSVFLSLWGSYLPPRETRGPFSVTRAAPVLGRGEHRRPGSRESLVSGGAFAKLPEGALCMSQLGLLKRKQVRAELTAASVRPATQITHFWVTTLQFSKSDGLWEARAGPRVQAACIHCTRGVLGAPRVTCHLPPSDHRHPEECCPCCLM